MHLDLWSPGITTDATGKPGYLLNSICDLTQFVVSSITFNTEATVLARLFMEDVVLSFGMVAFVVVDADSRFRSVFEEVCTILKSDTADEAQFIPKHSFELIQWIHINIYF